jgi:hypothetical protein
MTVLRRLLERFGKGTTSYPKDYWPSVVMLLREPHIPTPEEVLRTAQESWGVHAPVESVGKLKGNTGYILRSGGLIFSVQFGADRYGVKGQQAIEALQRPWDEHKAWMSVDMPNERNERLYETRALGGSYQLLLVFAFKSWSANCLGVYFPAEGVTIPNFGELTESIQWGRKNGLGLDFMK